MYNNLTRKVRSLAWLLATLGTTTIARADDPPPSTDPTEPVATEPLVSVPMPGGKSANGDEDPAEESLPGDPWGDVGSGGLLSLRALFQFRYTSTFAEDSTNERESYVVREEYLVQQGDGWAINRLFVRLGSDPSRYLGFKAVFDFAQLLEGDPEDVVKQAYGTLRPMPDHIELTAGSFKIPFSTLELDASSRWEFAEFGPIDQLIVDMGYAGRDLGAQLQIAPLKKAKRLRITGGTFRGHATDEHDSPSGTVAVRIEAKPNKHFRIGANYAQKLRAVVYNRPFETSDKDELPNPPDPLYPAQKRYDSGRAAGGDLRFKMKGFMLRGEGIYGDRIDVDTRYDARTFWGAWGIIAYRIDIGSVRVLPAFRAEWLDADRENPVGVQRQLGGALNVLFLERCRFVVELTQTEVQANTPLLKQPKPLQTDPYLALDNLRTIAQLQIEL
jgi:hypothetical protein